MRRRTVATVTLVALAPGVALLGMALAADPIPSTVGITAPDGASTPSVTPTALAVSPGALLQFSLAPSSGVTVRVLRASPPAFDFTLAPGGTTSPTPITASPTTLVYSVFPYAPAQLGGLAGPESAGPTQTAEVLVTPTTPATATPSATETSPAPATSGAPTVAPTAPASVTPSPTPTAAPTSRASAKPSRSASPRASSRPTPARTSAAQHSASPKPSGSASSSASDSGLPTPEIVQPPPGVLILPSSVPRFTPSPGSSPQIYDPHASMAPVAQGATTPPAAGATPDAVAPTATQLAADLPVTNLPGERVAARERGLPVVLAAVLLLGVGGAVGRAVSTVARGRGRGGR